MPNKLLYVKPPKYNEDTGKWEVEYQREGSKRRASTFEVRERADIKYIKLSEQKETIVPEQAKQLVSNLPQYRDGRSKFFKKALGDVVKGAHDACNREDVKGIACIEKYARVLMTASNAIIPHKRIEELEDQLEQATKTIREMKRQKIEENATESKQSGDSNTGVQKSVKSSKALL